MAKFVALTSVGLREELEKEIEAQKDLKIIGKDSGSIIFESNWAGCYRANLCLRTATKILLWVLDFPAYKPEDLYYNIRRHDFTKYIRVDQTISIDAHTRESVLQDQRLIAMKTKDAIVDQFREKYGERPNIDGKAPDLEVVLKIVKNHVSVAINTTGDSLSLRGYRKFNVQAPLREHLAAGLLSMTGWEPSIPLVDPMCGSGTFLIEAALIALNVAPGTFRKHFSFQKHLNFQPEIWSEVLESTIAKELESFPCQLYGYDCDSKILRTAKKNAEMAGVEEHIIFQRGDVVTLVPPPELTSLPPGIIIVNPPYGERMGISEQLKDVYRDLAHSLKQNFKGWKLFMLSGNMELTSALRLKASHKKKVYNGNLDCRFLEYQIR